LTGDPSGDAVPRDRYWSARGVAGHCGAVLDPVSLKAVELNKQQTWVCRVSATAALMRHEQTSITLKFKQPA
jgi:hypothetical protein